jgi:2-polyprenyl-3-methyl-5-hydroxy-6-metoxy-1,4-benzoquinol methylase
MPNTLHYTPFERLDVPRPVDRLAHIARLCQGQVVLDLGAMDETAFVRKRGSGAWLHEEIARTARRVIGVDVSSAVPPEGLTTAPDARIERGDILDLAAFVARLDVVPDVVVAGELIEHLDNPLAFLSGLVGVPALAGKRLILSTPNATALHNVLIGLGNRESAHQDHLCILSYKTLTTLMSRAGYADWRIVPYRSEFAEMKLRNAGLRRTVVVAGEQVIRTAEWLFPLLSFGLVVEAVIPPKAA